jgi:hypothetical protein
MLETGVLLEFPLTSIPFTQHEVDLKEIDGHFTAGIDNLNCRDNERGGVAEPNNTLKKRRMP